MNREVDQYKAELEATLRKLEKDNCDGENCYIVTYFEDCGIADSGWLHTNLRDWLIEQNLVKPKATSPASEVWWVRLTEEGRVFTFEKYNSEQAEEKEFEGIKKDLIINEHKNIPIDNQIKIFELVKNWWWLLGGLLGLGIFIGKVFL